MPTEKRPRVKSKPTETAKIHERPRGSRPVSAISYVIALVVASSLGIWSITTIHSRVLAANEPQSPAPETRPDPYTTAQVLPPGAQPARELIATAPPESTELIRSQGWVKPSAVEIYDENNKEAWLPKEGLAAEIAVVAEIHSDVLPMAVDPRQTQGNFAGASAALPGGSNVNGTPGFNLGVSPISPTAQARLAPPPLPSLRLPGWGPPVAPQTEVTELGRAAVTPVEAQTDQLESVLQALEAPSPQNEQAALAPPNQQESLATEAPTLAAQIERDCAEAGFFGRHNCEQRVKAEYCEDRWGRTAECQRTESVVNF